MTKKTAAKIAAEPLSNPAADRSRMMVAVVGHVDHGKSTFIGRLLNDTGALQEGKIEALKRASARRGMPFEWAFVMDALQAERDQGITIDVSQVSFKTKKRDYTLIDTPGHREFLKNMISGAAGGDAAILIIDAKEGIREQSRRHAFLLQLLGHSQVAVLINKMDAVGYDEAVFRAIEEEYSAYLTAIGIRRQAQIIPVSAREGDNIATHSKAMPWYKGPTLLGALDGFALAEPPDILPLRLSVQDVYKFDDRRIFAGRIETGTLHVGDELLFSPTGQRAKVASIEAWGAGKPPESARAGECIGITLTEQIFAERGHVVSHAENPPLISNRFHARLFWLSSKPLVKGKRYRLRIGTAEYAAEIAEITRVIDTETLHPSKAESVERNQIAEALIKLKGLAALDENLKATGSFVLIEDHIICGGGVVYLTGIENQRQIAEKTKSKNITAFDLRVTPKDRARINGHTGGIIWLTGLPSSGKSTVALELDQQLFARGCHTYVLDGDNIRGGLNKDLGFSAADRAENVRRIGEVAALFAGAGLIVIVAFISPYDADRKRARAASPEAFHLVHVKARLDVCEKRDVKGLYKKARAGKIKDFTGISSPYEEPRDADLTLDTASQTVKESVAVLMEYAIRQFVNPVSDFRDEMTDGG